MRECWKPIVDPSNIHNAYVSNTGKVKYLNARGQFKTTLGSAQNGGYLQVKLGRKKYCTHILVAKQWIKKKSSKFTVVHHINGIRSNNNVNNIQWTTQMLNCSLRRGSSLCIKKNNLFVSKFIFDGVVIKSKECFQTSELAKANALIMRRKMYDAAYNTLILNENLQEGNVGVHQTSAGISSNGFSICDES
jgi:hypothetical protein